MSWAPDGCTVEQRCSASGVRCSADDMTCQRDAWGRGLQATCETRPGGSEPVAVVYCPAAGEQRDSPVVWILLAVAFAIAAVGGLTAFVVFRKKLRS